MTIKELKIHGEKLYFSIANIQFKIYVSSTNNNREYIYVIEEEIDILDRTKGFNTTENAISYICQEMKILAENILKEV